MTTVRVAKSENPFVQIDKRCLNDTRLSWRARGLLSYLLSKPNNWQIKIGDLVKQAPDGRDACYSIINELKTHGYVERYPIKDEKGKILHWETVIREIPISQASHPLPENPDQDKPDLVEPDQAEPQRSNNDLKNKEPTNTLPKGKGVLGRESHSSSPACGVTGAPQVRPTADGTASDVNRMSHIDLLNTIEELIGADDYRKLNWYISKGKISDDAIRRTIKDFRIESDRGTIRKPGGWFRNKLFSYAGIEPSKKKPEGNSSPHSEASRTSEKAKHDSFPVFTSEVALMRHLGLTSASKYKDMEPNLTAIASEEIERLPVGLPIFQTGLSSPWVLVGHKPPQNEFSGPQFLFRQIGKPKQSPSTCSVGDLRLVKQIPWQGPIESTPTNQGYCYGVFRSESKQLAILCHVEGDRIFPIELPNGFNHVGFATINVSIVTQLVAA